METDSAPPRDRVELTSGWDSVAVLVDGRWLERRPRRPEVAAALLRESRLLPWLSGRLPIRVPTPTVVQSDPFVVRHELVPGQPIREFTAEQGTALGGFLAALHVVDPVEAVAHGLFTRRATRQQRSRLLLRLTSEVVPLLPTAHRPRAERLLSAVSSLPADHVVHGDLGPEHVLTVNGEITGVIDFGDVHLGDPAIDLAWALYGTPEHFARALVAAYLPSQDTVERALLWHQLGPWHEVLQGLDTGDGALVDSGIAGVLRRLGS
ncbi:phosphotransferase [Actinoalloteichus spitiensis]|uniref:phosphotransferase n=1 Tax=Actinoalloteichus spitiensis TaxID=252394 RepID=UPI00037BC550|nr:phosphotransferase [Actinoalloteichus spitiensis]